MHRGQSGLENAGAAIRAFLRTEIPEPARAPEPAVPAEVPRPAAVEVNAARNEVQPPVEPKAAQPPVEPKSEPPRQAAGGRQESTNVAAIPASFFDPSQLTEKPRPLNEPRVDLLLPLLGGAGVANLILYVDELGNVERVEIASATLSAEAAQRAVAIFAALRFSPGRIDGAAVKTRVRITVGAEEQPRER